MYNCSCVYTYVCMGVQVYNVCVYVCVIICIYVWGCMCMCLCAYVYVYMYICMDLYSIPMSFYCIDSALEHVSL